MNEASRFRELLTDNLHEICQLTDDHIGQLYAHYRLLARWNRHMNLTTVQGLENIALRHYCESLFLGAHLPSGKVSVADVGSGAGFPGFPIAVLRPDCRITLIEPHKRKAVFLRESTRTLSNVVVFAARAELLSERFDWVVSRAVPWERCLPTVAGLASRIALLIGGESCRNIMKTNIIAWESRIAIPWTRNSAVLVGTPVPRGTIRQPVSRET